MQKIDLSNNPNQQFSVVLDGQNCVVSLRQLGARVYLSIICDHEVVCSSTMCRDRQPMPIFSTTKFKGKLMFIDTRGKQNPQSEAFGSRYVLIYLSEGEEWQKLSQKSD